MKKKLLFLALAICLVITAVVTVVSAAEPTAANETATDNGGATVKRNPETVLEDGSVQTVYGTIPADKADASAYPIVVFMNNTFKGASNVFAKKVDGNNTGAFQTAKNLMDNNSEKDNKVQIYLRNNITVSGRNDNTGQMSGTLTVDLNGYTASCGSYMIYDSVGKKYEDVYPLNIITKNGYITTKAPLLNVSAYGTGYADLSTPVKTITFDFENVESVTVSIEKLQ
jgi:hypothetical protein